jgi:actin
MSDSTLNYSAVIADIGSGVIKAGFSGEDGPRSVFSSIVGIPKMPGLLVGMEQKERYVGEEAVSKLEIMNFSSPIKKGEIVDWDKFETLMHHLFYTELKVVPEEISILITESPLNSKENRAKLAETLFETFNVDKLHIANSSMLGLYSYGKTSGLVLDSGFGITTCVPVYEGYPLPHASLKMDFGGENLSETLLTMIHHNINKSYKGVKGRLLADDIKEKLGYVALNSEDEEKHYLENLGKEQEYFLPDNTKIKLGPELFKHSELLFRPQNEGQTPLSQFILESISKCDNDIIQDIQENICLTGGTTLLNGFTDRLKNELLQSLNNNAFNVVHTPERQFSNWIGGSIISSLNNFNFMWVSKQEYDEVGNALEAVDSKCF